MELKTDKLVTRSGSEYYLGQIHQDYKGFIEAYENGVAILKDWSFSSGKLFGRIFKNGNYEKNVDDLDISDHIYGRVIAQDIEKNLCTIQTSRGTQTLYVDWHSISPRMLFNLELRLSSKQLESLLDYAGKKVKLDIFGVHKDLLQRY